MKDEQDLKEEKEKEKAKKIDFMAYNSGEESGDDDGCMGCGTGGGDKSDDEGDPG